MDGILLSIEQLAPVRALKLSFYAYPIINAAHILAVGALLTCVTLLDLRILGALRAQQAGPFGMLMRRIALSAFAGAAATGIALFSVRASDYAAMPLFLLKLSLIALAIGNFLVFARLAGLDPGRPLGPVAKLLAALSIGLWLAILVCGRFLGFV
ncbi:MAG: hypothetical protein AB7I79_05745 [Rhizobiaceae bacterium]